MFTGRCDCLRWVVPRFCCRTLKFFVELRGAGLAVVTVNWVALIWKLVWIDFLTIRVAVFLLLFVRKVGLPTLARNARSSVEVVEKFYSYNLASQMILTC